MAQSTLPHRSSARPGTIAATQTQTNTPILRLRAVQDQQASEPSTRPAIRWAEDVIDNEGMGRKKSKVCCIYHAPKAFGESSSESSSDSSSEDDSDGGGGDDDGKARMGGKGKAGRRRRDEDEHKHIEGDHEHDGCKHDQSHAKRTMKAKREGTAGKRKSGNAYETQPKPPKGGKAVEVRS